MPAAPDLAAPDPAPDDDRQDFAPAAGPFAGDTVRRTGTAGLHAGLTTIPVGDLAMPAYVARPEHGTDLPVVLVLPEAYPDAALFPAHPLDVVDRLTAPVLGLHGGQDEAIPLDTVERMRSLLAARPAGAPDAELLVFPGAGHAFHADYRESYSRPDAEQGWKRTLAWFAQHGA